MQQSSENVVRLIISMIIVVSRMSNRFTINKRREVLVLSLVRDLAFVKVV